MAKVSKHLAKQHARVAFPSQDALDTCARALVELLTEPHHQKGPAGKHSAWVSGRMLVTGSA